jgi:hypothetical protein
MMNYDLVAEDNPLDLRTDGIDDATGVAPTDVKVSRVSSSLPFRDDINWHTLGSPHVVEVDSGRHHTNQHLIGFELWRMDFFDAERCIGLTQPVLPYHLSEHPFWNLPYRWEVAIFDLSDLRHWYPPLQLSLLHPGNRGTQYVGYPTLCARLDDQSYS